MKYTANIGLEVHVQLATQTKMFCACRTTFGAPPNTQVCPGCLGYPGSLPLINAEAIRLTVMTGLMLGCTINARSQFDRKNYFYPDAPKNYQISQSVLPLCSGGSLEIECAGELRTIRLQRIHLEEDVGKSMHGGELSSLDFNRAGLSLMEIVTEPELRSPEEAFAFLQALKRILLYGGISHCNLEEGNLRCDINSSVRPADRAALGVKTEIKNLNTFKGVLQALRYEIGRQQEVLQAGQTVVQETRRWETEQGITLAMRSKEAAQDYRYFPDPDLLPVILDAAQIEAWRDALPELPRQRCERLTLQYGLPDYDARVLSADKALADYFEEACRLVADQAAQATFKALANWMMTEMLRLLAEKEMEIQQVAFQPSDLLKLVQLVEGQVLNARTAKEVLAALFVTGGDPETWVRQKGLLQVTDTVQLEELVDQALAAHAGSVADFRAGKAAALQFLVGQVMRLSQGKAHPQRVQDLLKKKLTAGSAPA